VDLSRPTPPLIYAADGKQVLHGDGSLDGHVDGAAMREIGDKHVAGGDRADTCLRARAGIRR
jgi:hypothetical protein